MSFELHHSLTTDVSQSRLSVYVVGAGGTGSAVLSGLQKIATVAKRLGMPKLDVTVWDEDTVSPSNIGRQAFSPADIGRNKAAVLVNRINQTMGLDWECVPKRFSSEVVQKSWAREVVIGCVDSRRSRSEIHKLFSSSAKMIWIDCGNSKTTGQVVMGVREGHKTVLPCVGDLFPESIDPSGDETDPLPSCSVEESIARQDPLINMMVAEHAVNLLWRLMRFARLEAHGVFIDTEQSCVSPIRVDHEVWAAMGWNAPYPMKAA